MKDQLHIAVGTAGTALSGWLAINEKALAGMAALLTCIYMAVAIGLRMWQWDQGRRAARIAGQTLPVIAAMAIIALQFGCSTPVPGLIIKEERPNLVRQVHVTGTAATATMPTVDYTQEGVSIGAGWSFHAPASFDGNVILYIGAALIIGGIALLALKKWFPLMPPSIGGWTLAAGFAVLFVPYIGDKYAGVLALTIAASVLLFVAVSLYYTFKPCPKRAQQMKFGYA